MTSMQDLSAFAPRALPGATPLRGRFASVEPLDWDRHGPDLAEAVTGPENADLWRWLPWGPVPDGETLAAALQELSDREGWRMMAILSADTGSALGMAAYMRLRPAHGSVEVGCVLFGKALQRTPIATEAMHLMADHAFALGYRRYEWKCDAENAPSAAAARRLGFTAEGVFRNDMVVKGLNRDTLWLSIIDSEWPAIARAHRAWLDPENFDADGAQRRSLRDFLPAGASI